MGKFRNEEKAFLLALLAAISFSVRSCVGASDDKGNNTKHYETTIASTSGSVKNPINVDMTVFNKSEYCQVEGDNVYSLLPDSQVYITDGNSITDLKETKDVSVVKVLERNDEFSLVIFQNGDRGYVYNCLLIKPVILSNGEYVRINENNDDHLLMDAYLYDSNGLYIDFISADTPCHTITTNGSYTAIVLDDGRSGYVLSSVLPNEINHINGYVYTKSAVPLYTNHEMTDLACYVDANKVIGISEHNEKYCRAVINGKQYFINSNDVLSKFIIIDIKEQRIACYNDYQLAGCWKTRTGKLATPTEEGVFDIDYKQKNFTFTKHPGCYANYWILFNQEKEQGIHDFFVKDKDGHIIKDDVNNYGTQAYKEYGGLGCPRTEEEASEFVYNNYDVGDIVIVIYNSKVLLYNPVDSLLIVSDTDSYNRSKSR